MPSFLISSSGSYQPFSRTFFVFFWTKICTFECNTRKFATTPFQDRSLRFEDWFHKLVITIAGTKKLEIFVIQSLKNSPYIDRFIFSCSCVGNFTTIYNYHEMMRKRLLVSITVNQLIRINHHNLQSILHYIISIILMSYFCTCSLESFDREKDRQRAGINFVKFFICLPYVHNRDILHKHVLHVPLTNCYYVLIFFWR